MKTVISTVGAVIGVMFSLSLVFANPALLPKHPGYPSSGNANDKGQHNAGGKKALEESAEVSGKHAEQHLKDNNNGRIAEKQGAGRLPKVQGPQIKIEPPVSSATKVGADRVIQ
jgi:hypothetical protein